MIYLAGVVVVLVAGLAAMVVAERWDKAPALWVSLVVAAAARVAIVVLTARSPQPAEIAGFLEPVIGQPFDFGWGMPLTGELFLDGRDPRVNYFPLLTYVYAAQAALVHWTGIPWMYVGKLYSIVADVTLVWLIGRLALERQLLRSWQYACFPLALMVSGIHGQMEPLALTFAAGAFLYARRAHPSGAGAMFGLAVAAKTWPILIGAGFLRAFRNNSDRARAVVVAAAVPVAFLMTYRLFVETSLRDTLTRVAGYVSYAGEWGWTGLVRLVAGYERFLELSDGMASVGRWVTIGALLLAWIAFRRADALDLTAAVLLAFLVVTPGFGAQYLLWPVPFLLARPTRRTIPFLGIISVWAAFGYLVVGDFGYYVAWRHSDWWDYETVHLPWVAASLFVVVACLAVFPWERRRPQGSRQSRGLRKERSPRVIATDATSTAIDINR